MSNTGSYCLEPYTGPRSRYTCPRCEQPREFVRYLDQQTGEPVAEVVGRCNRETACGYNYTPRDYHRDRGLALVPAVAQRSPPRIYQVPRDCSFIEPSVVTSTMRVDDYTRNAFVQGLVLRFGITEAQRLAQLYRLGTARGEAVIFWQTDAQGLVRSGKVMRYDSTTLKRLKADAMGAAVNPTWAHALLRLPGFHLQQGLFGEHLLGKFAGQAVAIVESEKTAVVCAFYLKEFVWVATGGCAAAQLRDPRVVELLRGRPVHLVPDTGATEKWARIAQLLRAEGVAASVYDALEQLDRPANWDLADELLASSDQIARDFAIAP